MIKILKERNIKLPNQQIFKKIKFNMRNVSEKNKERFERKLIQVASKKIKEYEKEKKVLKLIKDQEKNLNGNYDFENIV